MTRRFDFVQPSHHPRVAARARRGLVVVAALLAAACGSAGTQPITTPMEYTLVQAADSIALPYRQDVKVGGAYLTFSGVEGDSRCPRGVTCVWSGDAVASIVVHPGCYKEGCKAASIPLSLHTHLDPKGGEGWGMRVQLLALTPEPVHGTTTDPRSYVAWVRATPLPER